MHLSTSYIEALIVPLTLNLFSLIFNVNGNYYYINDAEDEGSISAVVPDYSFLNIIG